MLELEAEEAAKEAASALGLDRDSSAQSHSRRDAYDEEDFFADTDYAAAAPPAGSWGADSEFGRLAAEAAKRVSSAAKARAARKAPALTAAKAKAATSASPSAGSTKMVPASDGPMPARRRRSVPKRRLLASDTLDESDLLVETPHAPGAEPEPLPEPDAPRRSDKPASNSTGTAAPSPEAELDPDEVDEEPIPGVSILPPIPPQDLVLSQADPQRAPWRGPLGAASSLSGGEDELEYQRRIEATYSIASHRVIRAREMLRLKKDGKDWTPLSRTLSKSYTIQLVQNALQNFYERYFPTPCEFELPPGRLNTYLHLDEYEAHKAEKARSKSVEHAGYLLVALAVLLAFSWRYLRQMRALQNCSCARRVSAAWRRWNVAGSAGPGGAYHPLSSGGSASAASSPAASPSRFHASAGTAMAATGPAPRSPSLRGHGDETAHTRKPAAASLAAATAAGELGGITV
jgi:hypothetical protein